MTPKRTTIQWLDTLRSLAILGVIVIHVSSPLVNMTYGTDMSFWWIGNVVDSAVRFSVPLFLMLSGATLLGKEYKLNEFYKRRFSRVLVPFLFWLVVYLVYRWLLLFPKQQPHELHSIFDWASNLFLKEGVSKHFWYIYMILFLYLFVPFLGKALQKLNLSVISNLLLVWVVLTFACKSIPLNMYNWSGEYGSKLLGYFLYSGYMVLGYYLSRLPVCTAKIRFSAAFIFVVSVAVSAVCTYFFSKNIHKLDLSMYGYLGINTIIQSISIFVWVKDSTFESKYLYETFETISKYSYSIYLVHILVISIMFDNGIYWAIANPLISLPVITLMVLVCSFAIIFVLRMFPGGKRVTG